MPKVLNVRKKTVTTATMKQKKIEAKGKPEQEKLRKSSISLPKYLKFYYYVTG